MTSSKALWETFRSGASKLHEDLALLSKDMAAEEEDTQVKEQLYKEQFMALFPQVRQKVEAHIGELRTLADDVDKVHRDCTISNVAASSTGVLSGILTGVGLLLAPETAGASLSLLAAAMGLEAVTAVTSVTSSIVDRLYSSAAKAKAERLLSTGIDIEKMNAEDQRHSASKIASLISKFLGLWGDIMVNTEAIRMAQNDSRSLNQAVEMMTIESSNQEQEALRGTVQAMTRGARVTGVAMVGFGLLAEVINLVDQSMSLYEGTKAETAEELRNRAQMLEGKLELLTGIYEHLQTCRVPESATPQGQKHGGALSERERERGGDTDVGQAGHREERNVEPGTREERGLEGEGNREKLFILDRRRHRGHE